LENIEEFCQHVKEADPNHKILANSHYAVITKQIFIAFKFSSSLTIMFQCSENIFAMISETYNKIS